MSSPAKPSVSFIVFALIQMAFSFWFLRVVQKCYKFFSVKECCGGYSSAQQAGYGAQQMVYGGGQAYTGQQNVYGGAVKPLD